MYRAWQGSQKCHFYHCVRSHFKFCNSTMSPVLPLTYISSAGNHKSSEVKCYTKLWKQFKSTYFIQRKGVEKLELAVDDDKYICTEWWKHFQCWGMPVSINLLMWWLCDSRKIYDEWLKRIILDFFLGWFYNGSHKNWHCPWTWKWSIIFTESLEFW